MRLGQHDRHFADDTFKRIFLSKNARISIKISRVCSLMSNQRYSSAGLYNDLAPTGRQAIIWTNDG